MLNCMLKIKKGFSHAAKTLAVTVIPVGVEPTTQ